MALVTALLLLAPVIAGKVAGRSAHRLPPAALALGDLSFLDTNDPFQCALLRDALNIYYPGRYDRNDSLWKAIVTWKKQEFVDKLHDARVAETLTAPVFLGICGMYAKFLFVYVIVLLLTYYGVQTLASLRFAWEKNRRTGCLHAGRLRRGLVAAGTGLGSMLLFCPAYVIAYAIRTEFDTDTVIFMILLGVVSNGLLITYADKFHAFLVAESRKGYVETAVVKNCRSAYGFHDPQGLPLFSILAPRKRFDGHIFDHIFANARHQYLGTIREQASFLISGLIIIEMALNIHGHLSYELLRQLLYKNFSIVAVIILFIFYTVKATEIFADYLMHRENRRLEG